MVNLAARLAARADAEHEGCVLCDQFTIQVQSAVLQLIYALAQMQHVSCCGALALR
jgi:hypothetical protein